MMAIRSLTVSGSQIMGDINNTHPMLLFENLEEITYRHLEGSVHHGDGLTGYDQ